MRTTENELSPREWAIYNNEKEMLQLQMDHARQIKELELEVQLVEARFSSWFKIPLLIILLPVKLLLVIPVVVYAIRGKDSPEQLWKLLS